MQPSNNRLTVDHYGRLLISGGFSLLRQLSLVAIATLRN